MVTNALTEEQFTAKYGMTFDEFSAKNNGLSEQQTSPVAPDPIEPKPQEGEGGSIVNALKNTALQAVSPVVGLANAGASLANYGANAAGLIEDETFDDNQDTIREYRDRFTGGDPTLQAGVNAPADLVAGVPQVISDLPGLYGLGAAGLTAITSDQSFAESLFREGGQERLTSHMTAVTQLLMQENPNLTPEQLEQQLTTYQDTDSFQAIYADTLRNGLSFATSGAIGINEAVGQSNRPMNQSLQSDILQAIGSGFVGVGTKTIARAGALLARNAALAAVGTALSNAPKPIKIAGRIAEIISPVTLPLTPGNVIANAAAGTVLATSIRTISGEPNSFPEITAENRAALADPSLLPAEPLTPSDPNEPATDPSSTLESLVIAAVAIGGGGLLTRALVRQVRGTPNTFTNAGETFAEQAETKNQIQDNPVTAQDKAKGLINDRAEIDEGIIRVTDEDTLNQVHAEVDHASPVVVQAQIREIENGEVIGDGIDIASITRMREHELTLSETELQAYHDGAAAANALNDRLIQQIDITKYLDQIAEDAVKARANANKATKKEAAREAEILAQREETLRQLDSNADIRPNLVDLDNAELKAMVDAANANPKIKALMEQQRRFVTGLNQYEFARGRIDRTELDFRTKHRPDYIPLRNDPTDGLSAFQRAKLWSSRMFDTDLATRNRSNFLSSIDARRDVTGASTFKVNNPIPPIEALRHRMHTVVREIAQNDARRTYINTFLNNDPGRKYFKEVLLRSKSGKATKKAVTRKQAMKFNSKVLEDDTQYVKYWDKGKVRAFTASDPSLIRTLQFAPHAVAPVFNQMRKVDQMFTTGVGAPWFATKAALWEGIIGALTKRPGRSTGIIDTHARMLLGETAGVNKAMDYAGALDPTFMLQMAGMIPYALTLKAIRQLGRKIAKDLSTDNGIFSAMASSPEGKKALIALSENLVRTYDQSNLAVQLNHTATHLTFRDELDVVDSMYKEGLLNVRSPTMKAAINGWYAVLNSVHDSAKNAFFSQNYARLKRQYPKGIPKLETEKLLHETRTLSGDMSRVSSNDRINQTVSTVPYGNTIIQSTRHMFNSTVGNAAKGKPLNMTRVGTNIGLGAIVANYMMSNGSEEMRDWWWREVPEWQRISNIPFPSLDLIMSWVSGEEREFSPDDIQLVSIPPEMIPFAQVVLSMTNSFGITAPAGITTLPEELVGGFGAGITSLFDVALPPAIEAGAAYFGQRVDLGNAVSGKGLFSEIRDKPFSGVDADKQNLHGALPAAMVEVIGAALGTAGRIVAESVDSFAINIAGDQTYMQASVRALQEVEYEAVRRVTDIPLLWHADSKEYLYTADAQRIREIQDIVAPVIKQQQIENTSSRSSSRGRLASIEQAGVEGPRRVTDPLVRVLMQQTHNTFNRGSFKRLDSTYANLRAKRHAVNSDRVALTPEQRREQLNDIVDEMQGIRRQQSDIVTNWINLMVTNHGAAFTAQFGESLTPETLAAAVDASAE